jgi:hypothetical protein
MPTLPFDETIHVLSNSESLQQGEVCVTADYLADRVRSKVRHDAVNGLTLKLRRQHIVATAQVGKAGMNYEWTNSFALRGANLNGQSKYFSIEPSTEVRVRPESVGAKAVRYLPSAAQLVAPSLPPFLGVMCRAAIDRISEHIIDQAVNSEIDDSPIVRKAGLWTYRFSMDQLGWHPLFSRVQIPGLGKAALLGDIVIARSIHFAEDKVKVQLGLHPLVRRMARELLPGVPDNLKGLPVADYDTLPGTLDKEGFEDLLDVVSDPESIADDAFGRLSGALSGTESPEPEEDEERNQSQGQSGRTFMNRAQDFLKDRNDANQSIFDRTETGPDQSTSEQSKIPSDDQIEPLNGSEDTGSIFGSALPGEQVDQEWTAELESMPLCPPEALVDGLDGFEIVDLGLEMI